MIKKITAAVLFKHKSKLKVVKNIIHGKLKKNQVLVKLYYSGICGSQIHEINGDRDNKKYLPHMLGHEGVGIVVDKHKSVKNLQKKQKVFLSWINSKKKNSDFPYYHYKEKKINAGLITTFNNFAVVSLNRVFKLPKNISMKKGILLSCSLPTGSGPVIKDNKNYNKKTLIIGLGGVGMCTLLALKFFKKNNIYILEKNPFRIKKAKLILKKLTSFSKISDMDKKLKFSYIYESSGNFKLINKAFDLLTNKGKLILTSHPNYKKKISLLPHEIIKGKRIIGNWGGGIDIEKRIKILCKILNQKINLKNIFFKKNYNIKEINQAIKDFKTGSVIKPIIKF
jgi:S-(hydroxymethyl)glutathione dehydrogenase / alcohol dehydrogenase